MKLLPPIAVLLFTLSFCCNLSERFAPKETPDSPSTKTETESNDTVEDDSDRSVEPDDEKTKPSAKEKSAPAKKKVGVSYKVYRNTRFGYRINYPANLLKAQGEAANMDGQVFKSGDTVMRVFGSNMLLNGNLRKEYAALLREKGGTASYKVLRSKFFVVSGVKNGKIYYQKTFLNGSDAYITFMIEYPVSKRKTYDRVVTKIVKSFK